MVYLHPKFVTFCFLLLLGTLVLTGAPLARAHGDIERSEPAADEVIPMAPAEVHIWYSQEVLRLEVANVIEVRGPDGTQVDEGDTQIDDDDRKHAFVSLQPELPPGLYTVSWRNLSAEDGHEGSGEFSFTVEGTAGESNPPPAQQTATETLATPPSPTPASPATPTTESTPAPPASGGLPCLGGVLLGGLFLAVTLSGSGREGRG
jgi:copper resistance protein C